MQYKSTLLKMDEQQLELYNIVQKYFLGSKVCIPIGNFNLFFSIALLCSSVCKNTTIFHFSLKSDFLKLQNNQKACTSHNVHTD